MKYFMTGYFHTHTVHSHGEGTIRDNVLAARAKGLREIAITDHGPGNQENGISRASVPEMRKIVTALNEEFDDITIHLGVEANINSKGNCLDVSPEEFDDFDFVIAGYHYGIDNGYCLENWKDFYKGYNSRELMMRNTQMALTAIYENNIRILTHPGDKANFDMLELARACAETDTWMEISTSHATLNVRQIKLCAKTDVKFVISSDAHMPSRVGSFEGGLRRALEAGLDPERIVNIERGEKDA